MQATIRPASAAGEASISPASAPQRRWEGSDSAPQRRWDTRRTEKRRRLAAVAQWCDGPVLRSDRLVEALERLVVSGDRVVLEGNNQKQADFLARSLAKTDPDVLNQLHLIMPSVSLPEHLSLIHI